MATPQRARPPGLYDVAKLAGVSHQTVSRVINSHPSVREETRRRVQDAIDELGYRRNVAARTLVTRRSNTIGVITSVSPLWGPSSTLIGVETAARDAGFYLTVAGLRSIEPAGVKEVLGHFIDQGVEGIVVIAPEAALAHMAEPFVTDLPVVMVAAGAEPAPGVQITSIDQEQGARLATRHLIELGHTRIGHIAGPEPWFDATARLRGVATGTRGRRAPPRPAGHRRLDGGQRTPHRATLAGQRAAAVGGLRRQRPDGIGAGAGDARRRGPGAHRCVDRRVRRHARRRPLRAGSDHRSAGPEHPGAAVHPDAAGCVEPDVRRVRPGCSRRWSSGRVPRPSGRPGLGWTSRAEFIPAR